MATTQVATVESMVVVAENDGEGPLSDLPAIVAEALDSSLEVLDAMDLLIGACVKHTSASEAGVVLADNAGALHVIASSSERTSDAEEAQLGTSEGSCWDCFRSGRTVDVPDVSTHERAWPTFAATMRERGLIGTFAEPIRLRGSTIGSLCVFADHKRGHDDRDVALLQILADTASAALVRHRDTNGARNLDEQISDALEARVTLEQAKGALAYKRDVRIDEAFHVLRESARKAKRSLRATAEEVLRGGSELPL